MRLHDGRQALFDFREGFFPACFNEFAVALDERRAQAVRVFVQVFQRCALGADIAMTEDVFVMAADADDFSVAEFEFQSATSFAERADAMGNGFGGRCWHA